MFRTRNLVLVSALLLACAASADETADASGGTTNAYNGASDYCGTTIEPQCTISAKDGHHRCGEAIGDMVRCVAHKAGNDNCSGAGCGNGDDWVKCSNGFLTQCGYVKVATNSPLCNEGGAVRAYLRSPTTWGQLYGHVEMVCGNHQYCSVYNEPIDHPWPQATPDACWFPSPDGKLPYASGTADTSSATTPSSATPSNSSANTSPPSAPTPASGLSIPSLNLPAMNGGAPTSTQIPPPNAATTVRPAAASTPAAILPTETSQSSAAIRRALPTFKNSGKTQSQGF